MITLSTARMTVLAIAAACLPVAAAGAAEPTLSDVAGCNQQAAERTGAGALPRHPGAPAPGLAHRAPDAAAPRDAARPGGDPAERAGTTVDARRAAPPATPPPAGGAAEKTDPSGAIITQSPDPLLRGMDAEKADDPAYRTAYRDCMRARQAR